MDGESKKIPLMGPSGLYEADEQEAPGLIGMGFKPATPEDIEFSSPVEKVKGALEVVGRGAIPFFTAAELLAGAEPERIRKRKEISIGEDLADIGEFGSMMLGPGIVGKGLGMIGKLAGVTKAAEMAAAASKFGTKAGLAEMAGSAVADGIEGKIGKLATKYGIEGAAFGVMDTLDRSLISPEPKDAMSVAADAISGGAMGLITGATGGALVGGAQKLWQQRFGNKAARALEQIKADTATPDLPGVQPGEMAPPSGPGATAVQEPMDLATIRKMAEKVSGLPVEELPQKQSLVDAMGRVKDLPGIVLPHEVEIQALENPIVFDKYRAALEMGDKDALALRNYRAMVKKSMVQNMEGQIKQLNPNPIIDATKSGLKTVELLTKNALEKRKNSSSFFQRFDKAATNPVSYLGDITQRLEQAIPGMAEYLEFDGVNGLLKLKPWESVAPFTKQTHRAASDIIKAINKKGLTIGQLRNARNNLSQYVNYISGTAQTNAQVGSLKKSLMDLIESEIYKHDSSLAVRDQFRAYAINEQNIDEIEKILGGKLLGVGKIGREVVPEEVMRKIFANSVTVNSAKEILGEQAFDSILGDYLAQRMNEFTDPAKKTFSTARMANFLSAKQKLPELEAAFSNKKGILQTITDLNTIARIIPDQEPIQPSGNVKTIIALGRNILKAKNINPLEFIGTVADMAANRAEKKEVKSFIDAVLKGEGKQAKAFYKFLDNPGKVSVSGFESMRQYIKYASRGHYLVIRAAKSALDEATKMPVLEKPQSDLDKFDRQVQKLQNDPDSLLGVGGEVPYYMPEQSGALGLNTGRVVSYLQQQRPQPIQTGPLDKPKQPTKAQLGSYNRTLQIAANPPYIFKLIKEGRLLSKDVQDLQSMYPDVYDKYVMQLLDSITEQIANQKQIPLRVKKSLSLFGAFPLETNLKPQNIQAAQATFMPQQAPQQQPLQQMAPKSTKKSRLPELTQTDSQRRSLK